MTEFRVDLSQYVEDLERTVMKMNDPIKVVEDHIAGLQSKIVDLEARVQSERLGRVVACQDWIAAVKVADDRYRAIESLLKDLANIHALRDEDAKTIDCQRAELEVAEEGYGYRPDHGPSAASRQINALEEVLREFVEKAEAKGCQGWLYDEIRNLLYSPVRKAKAVLGEPPADLFGKPVTFTTASGDRRGDLAAFCDSETKRVEERRKTLTDT